MAQEMRFEINIDVNEPDTNEQEVMNHIKWLFETYGSKYIILQSIKES